MTAYVFPAVHAHKARISIDAHNRSEPSKVYSGPHAGKMFLDAAMADRDPRWIPVFQPLILDPSNEVQLVDLSVEDVRLPKI